jgi:hypothetical protein
MIRDLYKMNPNSTRDRPLKTARTVSVPWKYFTVFQGNKVKDVYNPLPVYTFIKEIKELQSTDDTDKMNESLLKLLTSWNSVSTNYD